VHVLCASTVLKESSMTIDAAAHVGRGLSKERLEEIEGWIVHNDREKLDSDNRIDLTDDCRALIAEVRRLHASLLRHGIAPYTGDYVITADGLTPLTAPTPAS
jgi:hypothetical protein